MQVHLHVDLVYLFISITGIAATPIPTHSTTSLVNKLETPIYTDIYIYIYTCVCVCVSLRLANNGKINLATNIQAYADHWEMSGCLHDKSCLF